MSGFHKMMALSGLEDVVGARENPGLGSWIVAGVAQAGRAQQAVPCSSIWMA